MVFNSLPKKDTTKKSSFTQEEYDIYFNAASMGLWDAIEDLLDKGMPVDSIDNYVKVPPLIVAAKEGQLKVVNALLARKADVMKRDPQGNTAMHLAALFNRMDVMEALYKNNPACIAAVNKSSMTPLLIYINKQGDKSKSYPKAEAAISKFLIEKTAGYRLSVIERANHELAPGSSALEIKLKTYTALSLAILLGDLPLVKYLIEAKADMQNSLHQAAGSGHILIIKYLVEHAKVNVKERNPQGYTPEEIAKRAGHQQAALYLTSAAKKKKKSTSAEVIQSLTQKESTPPAPTEQSIGPAEEKNILDLIEDDYGVEMSKRLGDQEVKSSLSSTSPPPKEQKLDLKESKWNFSAFKKSIASLATSEQQKKIKQTLTEAIIENQLNIVQDLITQVPIDSEIHEGKTALQLAVRFGHDAIVEELIAKGAKQTEKSALGLTLIHLALSYGNFNTAALLLKLNPECIQDLDPSNHTPLHTFIMRVDLRSQLKVATQINILKSLISKKDKSLIEIPDKFQFKPLHSAIDLDDVHLVTALIQAGADCMAKDAAELYPFQTVKSVPVAKIIFNRMKTAQRITVIKEASDPFILNILTLAVKDLAFIKLLLDTLIEAKPVSKVFELVGALLHHAVDQRNMDLFNYLIKAKGSHPKLFLIRNDLQHTIPEAIINSIPTVFFQKDCSKATSEEKEQALTCLHMFMEVLDKIPEKFQIQLLQIKSSANGYDLPTLAERIGAPDISKSLVAKCEACLPKVKKEQQTTPDKTTTVQDTSLGKRKKVLLLRGKNIGNGLVKNANKLINSDPEQARMLYFHAAITFHNPKAQRLLAHCLRLGIGGDQNLQEAFSYYEQAAGYDKVALVYLAVCYRNGWGTNKSPADADRIIHNISSIGGFKCSFDQDNELFKNVEFANEVQALIELIQQPHKKVIQDFDFDYCAVSPESQIVVAPSQPKQKKQKPIAHSKKNKEKKKEAKESAKPEKPKDEKLEETQKNATSSEKDKGKSTVTITTAASQLAPIVEYSTLSIQQRPYVGKPKLKAPNRLPKPVMPALSFTSSTQSTPDGPSLQQDEVGLFVVGESKKAIKIPSSSVPVHSTEHKEKDPIKAYQTACTTNSVTPALCAAAIVAATDHQYSVARAIYFNAIKKEHAHWMGPEVCAAIITAASLNNDFILAKTVYSLAIKKENGHWMGPEVLSAILAAFKLQCFDAKKSFELILETKFAAAPKKPADSAAFSVKQALAELHQEFGCTWFEEGNSGRGILSYSPKPVAGPTTAQSLPSASLPENKKDQLVSDSAKKGAEHKQAQSELENKKAQLDSAPAKKAAEHKKALTVLENKKVQLVSAPAKKAAEHKTAQPKHTALVPAAKQSAFPFALLNLEAISDEQKKDSVPSIPSLDSKPAILPPFQMASNRAIKRTEANLVALDLLADPTKEQLAIVNGFLAKVLPCKNGVLTRKLKLPKRIQEPLSLLIDIIRQNSKGRIALAGSKVQYMLVQAILTALGLPQEYLSSKSDADLRVESGTADFTKISEQCVEVFGVELRTSPYFLNLRQLYIENTPYDVVESKELAVGLHEQAKGSDLTINSPLAVFHSESDSFEISTPIDCLTDIALRHVSTASLTNPQQWMENYQQGGEKRSSFVVRVLNVIKSHMKKPAVKMTKAELPTFLSILPQFEASLYDERTAGHVLDHVKKRMLQGNAVKFYKICSAYESDGLHLMDRIFPFMKTLKTEENINYILKCLKNMDSAYKKAKNRQGHPPRLDNFIARLLALSVLNQPAQQRIAIMRKTIEGHPLLKSLFQGKLAETNDFALREALSRVMRDHRTLSDRSLTKGKQSEAINKSVFMIPLKPEALSQIKSKAADFVQALAQSKSSSTKEGTALLAFFATEMKHTPHTKGQETKKESASSKAGKNVSFSVIQEKFNQAIFAFACEYFAPALEKFVEVLELIASATRNPQFPVEHKDDLAFFDNISSLAIALKDKPEARKHIYAIYWEKMQHQLALTVTTAKSGEEHQDEKASRPKSPIAAALRHHPLYSDSVTPSTESTSSAPVAASVPQLVT